MKNRVISLLIIMVLVFSWTSCSRSLGPETLPSTTLPPTTETTETSETTTQPTETEPLGPEPSSVAVVKDMPVKKYGMLYVVNGQLTTKTKTPVMLRGLSSDVLSECSGFFGAETIKTLAEDWGIDVLRIAVPADKVTESYVSNPEKYFKQTCDIIDLCIAQGIYVIVDWHIDNDGDPRKNQSKAVEFFSRIAGVYADTPNVIYEICNEPNGIRYDDKKKKAAVDWAKSVKPYAAAVIKAIRAIDKDNVIIVGTPDWSRDIDKAAASPISGVNICYSVHFNAGSDGAELQEKITAAREKGICVVATEWKSTDSSGVSSPDVEKTNKWLDYLEENNISWCNAYIGGNNSKSYNALVFGGERYSIEDIFAGHWPLGLISDSGLIVRDRIYSAKGVSQPEIKPEDMPKDTPGEKDLPDDEDMPDNEDMPEE